MPSRIKEKVDPTQLTTIATFILDASGSMAPLRKQVIDGLSEWLQGLKTEQAKNPNNRILVTLNQFNLGMGGQPQLTEAFAFVPALETTPLTEDDYTPGGGTPLYDCAVEAIKNCQSKLGGFSGKVAKLVMIMTDGEENASKTETRDSLRNLIEALEKDSWTFAYMGANQDAFQEAAKFGTQSSVSNTAAWQATAAGTVRLFRDATTSTQSYLNAVNNMASTGSPQASYRVENFYAGTTSDASGGLPAGQTPTPTFKVPSVKVVSKETSKERKARVRASR